MASVQRPANTMDQLVAAHPLLFAGRPFEVSGPYVATGWHAIAIAMCREIEVLLGEHTALHQPVQAKEKWGSWRYYWRLPLLPGESLDSRVSPFDFDVVGQLPERLSEGEDATDTLRVKTVYGERLTLLPTGRLRRAVMDRVRAAELATQRTCMWCGEPGTYWSDGWVHVACAKHRRPGAAPLEQ